MGKEKLPTANCGENGDNQGDFVNQNKVVTPVTGRGPTRAYS